MKRKTKEKKYLFILMGGLVLAGVLFTPRAEARWNPLLQIELQRLRPLVSLVIDKSGSMSWDFPGMYRNSSCDSGRGFYCFYRSTSGTSGYRRSGNWLYCRHNQNGYRCQRWINNRWRWRACPRDPDLSVLPGVASRIEVVRNIFIDGPDPKDNVPSALYQFDAGGSCVKVDPLRMVNGMFKSMNLGLVTFSYKPTTDVNVSADDDMAVQEPIRVSINQAIEDISPGGATNIGGGNENAFNSITNASSSDEKTECGRKRFIISITDGANNQPSDARACHIETGLGLTGDIDCFSNNCLLRSRNSNHNDITKCKMYTVAENAFKNENIRVFPIAMGAVATNGRVMYTMNRMACLGGVDASMPMAGVNLDVTEFYAQHKYPGEIACGHSYILDRTKCGMGDTTACNKTGGLGHLSFTADTPQKLQQVMNTIVSLLAVGDFGSSQPIATTVTGLQSAVFFATSEFPGWRGHFYRFDQTFDSNGNLVFNTTCTWDMAEMLCELGDDNVKNNQCGELAQDATKFATECTSRDLEQRKIYVDMADKSLIKLPVTGMLNPFKLNDPTRKIADRAITLCPDDASWWDPSTGVDPVTGCPNVIRAIDFILGGDGNCVVNKNGTFSLTLNPRPWLLGPSVGAQASIIGKPLRYSLQTAPDKSSFDATFATRSSVMVFPSDDGMIHAIDPNSGKELWAFMPAPQLCNVKKRLENYNPNLAPTGQAGTLDSHVYGINTKPGIADIWDENATGEKWKTAMFFGLANGADGVYAIDVTCSHPDDATCGNSNDPPFSVLWSLDRDFDNDGKPEIGRVWHIIPIGLFRGETEGGKEANWAVAIASGLGLDVNEDVAIYLFEADTGELIKTFSVASQYLKNPKLPDDEEGILAGPTLIESDRDVYFHDSLVTHIFSGDLAGSIHMMKTHTSNPGSWSFNSPSKLSFATAPGSANTHPFHHDLSVIHLNRTFNYMLSFVVGSALEDNFFYRGSDFQPFSGFQLLYLKSSSKDMTPLDTKIFTLNDMTLCLNFDASGNCTSEVSPSDLTRFTAEPITVVNPGSVRQSGFVLNLLFDPNFVTEVCNDPDCTSTSPFCGATFAQVIPFAINPSGTNGDNSAFIPNIQPQPAAKAGAGVITAIGTTLSGPFVIQSGIGRSNPARPQDVEQVRTPVTSQILQFKIIF